MELKFFNTETRSKEPLTTLKQGCVSMYTCGPTVYDFAHIGNFRTYVFEDILRRTLKFFGYKVEQVMNLTDVDDKTIRGAIKKGVTLDEYTKPFKQAFFEDLKTLKIESAEKYPAATDYIEEMIRLIHVMLDKKIAYLGGDGSVYYSIKSFSNYGRLSHLENKDLVAGASNRVASDEYEKDAVSDFVLWKKFDPERDGNIYWDSPFGKGRPGWHLECSAMAMKLLGSTIDIHVGGVDNIFPHHENEIAQSEACSGSQFVKLWMHSEHLLVDHKKMSKSLGNFYTLRNLLDKGFSGLQVRYLLLQTHYRTQLNFTFAGLEGAKNSIDRLHDFVIRLKEIEKEGSINNTFKLLVDKMEHNFSEHLADDLNMSNALASLFDLVRDVNSLIDKERLCKKDASYLLEKLKHIDTVLDVIFISDPQDFPQEMHDLLMKREEARKAKDWALADALRKEISAKGYIIEDTKGIPRLKKA
jgi:cysteinyl-tRNA synthetase